MPLSHPDASVRLDEIGCPDCMFTIGTEITIAGSTYGWCLNHLTYRMRPLLVEAQQNPETLSLGCCVACGRAHVVHLEDGQWNGDLCPGHAIAYISRCLNPIPFCCILVDAGVAQNEIFALHDHFYTEDGNAWQPGIEMPALLMRIQEIPELPEFDLKGNYDLPPMLLKELSKIARHDYRTWTGLEEDITDFLAKVLVIQATLADSYSREDVCTTGPRANFSCLSNLS